MGKIKFFGLLIIGGLLGLISSCLGGDKFENEEWNMANAQIMSFSLESNEVDLTDVKFTIDQLNGKIFNYDSLPFGTVFEEKMIAKIDFDNERYGIGAVLIIEASGDTVQSISDSIDFSAPVMITVTAIDGISTKSYEASLRIHQVNPDTMIWEQYAEIVPGKIFQDMKALLYDDRYYLYSVENGAYQLYVSDVKALVDWEKRDLSGFPNRAVISQLAVFEQAFYVVTEEGDLYCAADGQDWKPVASEWPVKALSGYLPADTISGRDAVLCCIVDVDGVLRFTTIDRQLVFTTGQPVPETFPLSGFSHLNYETRYYPRLVVAAGRDSQNKLSNMAWATMDGRTWAMLTHRDATFTPREGAAFVRYDGCFFVIGGIGADGEALKDVYFSKDQGVTWLHGVSVLQEDEDEDDDEEAEDVYVLKEIYPMPEDFAPRGYTSVFTDKDDYMLLFGGKAGKDKNVWNEIWRGRINRLGFGKE